MNTREVAQELGITTSTVRNQLEKGRLEGTKDDAGSWVIEVEAMERYRAGMLGNRHRDIRAHISEERRLAGIRRPETRAKMRAAKLGRHQSAEHIAKRAATAIGRPLSPEHRARIRVAQEGKTLAPDHLAALRAAHGRPEVRERMSRAQTGRVQSAETRARISAAKRGRPLSQAHREAISRGLVAAYLSGRRPYSALEVRAAALLLPLGCTRFPWLDGHAFDFASADARTVYEINGCRFHDHRLDDPNCPFTPMHKADNATYRRIAAARGLRLVELWECRESDWVALI